MSRAFETFQEIVSMVEGARAQPDGAQPAKNDGACDRDGCSATAVYEYIWPWGERGRCCADHAFVLQQVAQQIERPLQLLPLQQATPAPLTRDERTQLIAAKLAVEAEVQELQSRGLELYRVNRDLAAQVQLAAVQKTELLAQLKDARANIEQLGRELEARERENGELAVENDRLKHVEAFSRGVPTTTVVDG